MMFFTRGIDKIPSSRLIHFLLHKQLHLTPPTKITTIAVSPDILSEGEGKFLLKKKCHIRQKQNLIQAVTNLKTFMLRSRFHSPESAVPSVKREDISIPIQL